MPLPNRSSRFKWYNGGKMVKIPSYFKSSEVDFDPYMVGGGDIQSEPPSPGKRCVIS